MGNERRNRYLNLVSPAAASLLTVHYSLFRQIKKTPHGKELF